jgi:hypothetical protein
LKALRKLGDGRGGLSNSDSELFLRLVRQADDFDVGNRPACGSLCRRRHEVADRAAFDLRGALRQLQRS